MFENLLTVHAIDMSIISTISFCLKNRETWMTSTGTSSTWW